MKKLRKGYTVVEYVAGAALITGSLALVFTAIFFAMKGQGEKIMSKLGDVAITATATP